MGGRRAAVAVVGSCNMDFAVFADRLPAAGETVTGRSLLTAPGGKGANQAIAAARAGGQVRMIGAVGDDAAGAQVRACLDRAGADVTALRTVPEPTGSAHITVDAAGTNSIVVIPGANASVTELTAADRAVIAVSDVLLLQLELPVTVVTAAAAAGGPAGPLVVLTPAPAPARPLPRQLLDLVGLLVANEHEARQLAGGGGDALTALLALAPAVVITLGAAGCRYGRRDGTRISMPAPAVAAVDTTAAGDTFTGALAVALAEGRPAADALRWATSAAALCVQQPGAAGSMPGRAEIDALARTLTVPGQHREPAPGA